jgi:NTE family protein
MRKTRWMIVVLTCYISLLNAQKIGLVLSGGGAPGLAHIGIIKALEENNIPIDCIAGTSIGAIVGGMYAMGMTPVEMINLIKSPEFKNWMTGELETEDTYFYRYSEPKPWIFEMRVQIDKKKPFRFKTRILPTNYVSSGQMNYAFIPLCVQANAVAKDNFDSLMIPFRCVASDVYNKKAVVFRNGVLGDAIRASMTYPFMFKPISIDSTLFFDGGLYNNFPVDVMKKNFNPDFILGSVVAFNPPKADADDGLLQLQNMIISRTDYSLPTSDGIILKFDLEKIKVFDFSKVDTLVKMGYDSVMKHLNEIKLRIPRRVSKEEISHRRKEFREKFPELKFQNIFITGVDSMQKKYINRSFQKDGNIFSLSSFRQSYFKLISNDKISEVIPHALFNPTTRLFDLNLHVKTEEPLKIMFSGNISSSVSNQAYLGIVYQKLSDYAQTSSIDAQFGKFYNSLGYGSRIEMPGQTTSHLKVEFVLHSFDYSDGNSLISQNNRTLNFNLNEIYSKMSIGFPFSIQGRMEFGIGYGVLTDNYNHIGAIQTSTLGNDQSLFEIGKLYSRIESNTLNNAMYPTKGFDYLSSFQILKGVESYKPSLTTIVNLPDKHDLWVQYRTTFDRYYPVSSFFTIGTYGELNYSSRKLLQNYFVSLMQAPSFQPTLFSRTMFNGAFCANQFGAVGLKPVFILSDQIHLRSEAYLFIPYQSIYRAPDNTAYYSTRFSGIQFITETALVYNFKLATAGLFLNSGSGSFYIGFNIGILLFNSKFLE